MTRQLIAALILTTAVSAFADSGPDLKSATGTVLIAAPTALNGPTNQGIWFVRPSDKAFSLNLPELAPDQVYEGWVVDECTGKKVSSGIFRAHPGTDSDAAGPYKGPLGLNYPPVPGSDYVTLGQDLADGGHMIVITVEPYPDMDPNPSGRVVLRTRIPAGTMAGTELMLKNVAQ